MRMLSVAAALICLASPHGLQAADPAKATVQDLSASDLAAALRLRWWSYKLQFDKPVNGVHVKLVELRRKPDGTWDVTDISAGRGRVSKGATISEIDVSIVLDEKTDSKELWFRLGGTSGALKLLKRPDFDGMYTNPTTARWVDGYLGLAFEEKDRHFSTDLDENLARVIALEIKLE